MASVSGWDNYWPHIFSDNSSSNDKQTLVSFKLFGETISIMQKREKCKSKKAASIFAKFFLLMWKNFLLQYRHKIQTIVQILIPMLFTVNLLFIRFLVKPEINRESTYFKSFNINTLQPFHEAHTNIKCNETDLALIYSPENNFFDELLKEVANDLSQASKLSWSVHGVNSSEEVEKKMKGREFVAGIEFVHSKEIAKLPKNLEYALRFPSELRTNYTNDSVIFSWQTVLRYPQFSGGGPRAKNTNEGGAPNYFFERFLAIQHLIALRFAKKHVIGYRHDKSIPNIQMQRFPYPSYTEDDLLGGLDKAVGLFVMLSFIYPIICTVRFIAVEKEKQLKEIMKIMGMPVWLHWVSWFVRTMIFLLMSNTLVIALLKIPMFESTIAIFTYSNWFSMWVFLLVYSVAMTTYCFMLSVLFSRANTAAAVSGLVWFVSHMPFVFLTINNIKVPSFVQWLSCISPNVAMSYGFKTIAELERNGHGLQWWNFGEISQLNDSNIAVKTTINFMLITSVVFLLIAFYIEKVFPGEYGVPHKWNFFTKSDFWLGDDGYTKREPSIAHMVNENFEAEPLNCDAGVRVKNLRKVFTNGKEACKDVTFNMFRDQITVLLGHNGAGKSTTIKMLTGMIPPTSGTAIINGYDIRTDLRRARESIGVCPQHDILFDELTVREHIEFYCRLKGLNWEAVEKEVKKYVQLLNLESKIDTPSKALSGGMQRKLSFIVALCGESKVVLCDEPTSGVDPGARRELWDLIQGEKFGRTIILTTHFMDEADVLGDRIAIMADGEVKCCGSPFFLKKRFGSGYRLICVKQMGCESSEVTAVLREFIPEVELLEETVEELSYDLPYEHSAKFSKMFERLENELKRLKILQFGVSSTELEEVFLKVGSDHKKPNVELHQNGDMHEIESMEKKLLSGFRLRMNHWYAMFKKRYYCWTNSWILFMVQIFILIFFTAISVSFARLSSDPKNLRNLDLSLKSYDETLTMLEKPQGNDSIIDRIVNQYRSEFNPPKDTLDEFSEDIQEHFLKHGDEIRIRTNTRYLVGLSVRNNTFIAWFNGQLFHTAPLSLNLLHNAVLKEIIGEDYSIKVSNWPIPFRPESKIILTMNGDDLGSQLAMYISFAMAFIIALYIMFHIREKASKAKLLQFISGVDTSTFWVTSFLFDFAMYSFVSFVFYLTILAFQEEYWSTTKELKPLLVIFAVFGLSSLAITYVVSLLFSNASYGFVSLAIIFVFTGTSFFKLITILLSPIFDQVEVANNLKWIFLAFPHYALGNCLFNMNQFRISHKMCCLKYDDCTDCDMSIYEWNEPGISRSLTYMAVTAATFLIILCIIEYRIIARVIHYYRRPTQEPPTLFVSNAIDCDVINEKIKVNAMTLDDLQNHNLVVQNLTKFYGNFLAVKEICVAVKMAECFGLLGINGAGKTTTFKMMTGDTSISSGDVFLMGLSLKTQLAEIQKLIGYCPQFDALLDNLTGSQTLEIFGLLRGYRRKDISAMSARLAGSLNFTKHIDKEIKSYSGGNKRKLSTAIALMGNPAVAYLDEPSSGMDPGAKRNLWSTVLKTRNSGTSIVLTSHSMEECEALCTRIAIMVNGEFKCLGSAQHLKNQFSKGFMLTIKIRSNDSMNQADPEINQNRIKQIICRNYPGAYLKEKYQGLLTFYVPQTIELKWSTMFDHMETIKVLGIEDYSISQTTLEQVFLSFTKPFDEQRQDDFN